MSPCPRSSIWVCSTTANSRTAAARRLLLRAGLAAGAWLALTGHSPYRQWEVHRKARLVLLVSRTDERAMALGKTVATLYAERLPQSRASMARARDHNDLVRLMASKQLDVALLPQLEARAMLLGEGRYAPSGALALRALAILGEHVIVCRDDLPKASAYLLTEALAEGWNDIDPTLVGSATGPRPAGELAIPLHPGALEYYGDHR